MKNPNGYGCIIKLSGKRRRPYAVKITIGYDTKNQLRKYIGYATTYQEANKILIEYNENRNVVVNNVTVAKIYELWSVKHFKQVKKQAISKSTSAYKYLEPIKNVPIKDLKTTDLQKIINTLSSKLGMQKAVKGLLNQLYNYAMRNDIVIKDYSKFIELDKYEKKIDRKIYTQEEIEILWNNLDIDYVDTILILIYTGFRIGELLELKTENINLEEQYIVGGIKTDAGKNRLVPINSKILPLIKNRMNTDNENFVKISYHTYRNTYKSIMKKLEMKHTIHDTRHTFASLLNNAEANKSSIIKLIGHTNFNTTEKVYTHKDINELRKAIDKI